MVKTYKALQHLFDGFCNEFTQVFTANNEFGFVPGSIEPTSFDLKILGHQCRALFGIHGGENVVIGKITFQRVTAKDKTKDFLTIYFDRLGNAREDLNEAVWPYSINGSDISHWVALRVMEQFFANLLQDHE